MKTRKSAVTQTRRAWLALALISVLAWTGCATPAPPTPAPPSLRSVQEAALRDLGFNDTPDGWEMDIAVSMTFQFNDASLTPSDQTRLIHVAQVLRSVGIDHLTVEGHTDNQGSNDHNRQLSERRAKVVADALAESGFARTGIDRRAYGSSRPIADNSTPAGRERNRRAVLIVPSL
jgi:outer membrane protein OmpA-like peptidoglycan-associated protein